MTCIRASLVLFMLVLAAGTMWAYPDAWDYEDAIGQVCFNVSPSVAFTGQNGSAFYGIMNISLDQNTTFWNGSILGYYPASGTTFDVFNFANSTTDIYFIMPVIRTIAAGTNATYCMYVGDEEHNNITRLAPYGLGFDTSISHLTATNYSGSYTTSWNGTYLTVNATGRVGFKPSSSSATNTQMLVIGRFRPYDATGDGGMMVNRYAVNSTSFLSDGAGIGLFNNSMAGYWYDSMTGRFLTATNTSFNIHMIKDKGNGSPYYQNYTIWADDMTFIAGNNSTAGYASHSPEDINLIFANGSAMEYDWAVAGYYPHDLVLTTYDGVYDLQDANISFIAPTWGSDYYMEDTVTVSVYFSQAYDTCNLTINDNLVATYTPGAGDTVSSNVDMALGSDGDNWLTANCSLSGITSHRYHYIQRSGGAADELFEDAFGYSPADYGCNVSVQLELLDCFESYNLTERTDFAAVVCTGINNSFDYECLHANGSIHNVTKNGYTIFFRPDTYVYPGSSIGGGNHAAIEIEHVGAVFIYGATLIPGLELLPNVTVGAQTHNFFVYIPAQNKSRDCGIYYSDTDDGCSDGNGFILNRGVVIVSDRNDNWFTAAGSSIEPFNINYSQQSPAIAVYPIITPTEDVFPDGIFTRLNCYVGNDSYNIKVKNTLIQNYTLTITYDSAPTYETTTESFQLYRTVDLTDVDTITLTVDGATICSYGNITNLFLPFSLPTGFIPSGYDILITAMMIFFTVLTAIVPFAAIILVVFNDLYHLLNVSQLATVTLMAIIFGFVNASFNMERGIKHMLIILAIVTAYLSVVEPYAEEAGISIAGFDTTIQAFDDLRDANSIYSFVYSLPGFIIALFVVILTLPFTVVTFVLSMLYYISPTLHTAANGIAPFLTLGLVLYFYLKAYEVLSNRFRPV